jgi:hypothetical protein
MTIALSIALVLAAPILAAASFSCWLMQSGLLF